MPRPIIGLPILCLAGMLAACSTGAAPSLAPTNGSSSPAAPATGSTGGTTPTDGADVPRLALGSQNAGTYQLMAQDPLIRVTLAAGWSLYFDETGGTYMSLGDGEFLVGRNSEVIDPETNIPAPIPENVIDWFVDHPSLNASDPTPVVISGMQASYVDVNPTQSVDVFYDPLGNFHVGPGPMARFYVVPLEGPDLFIAVLAAPSGNLEDALVLGVPVVESLEIISTP